jgi:hypothetical protein
MRGDHSRSGRHHEKNFGLPVGKRRLLQIGRIPMAYDAAATLESFRRNRLKTEE